VDEVEQRRKAMAEAHASSAAVADPKHPLHLLMERGLVVEIGILPIQRMARRRHQIALADGTGHVPEPPSIRRARAKRPRSRQNPYDPLPTDSAQLNSFRAF